MTTSPEYEAARKAHDDALISYNAARALYMACQMGDADFNDALAAKKRADAAFDLSFAMEQNRKIDAGMPTDDELFDHIFG